MNLSIEIEREHDGRWIAEALGLPGVMTYGATCEDAISNTEKLAVQVIADRIQHGELPPSALNVSFLILREHLAGDPGTRRGQYKLRWRTERGRLLPGVPLDDRNVLLDVMGGP